MGVLDVLQHVGGEGDIGRPVREGQQIAVRDDRVPRPPRRPVTQHRGVRLEEIALRAAPPELPGEVTGAAADVDDDLPLQGDMPLDLVRRVPGQQGVDGLRVLGLAQEGAEQREGAAEGRVFHGRAPIGRVRVPLIASAATASNWVTLLLHR